MPFPPNPPVPSQSRKRTKRVPNEEDGLPSAGGKSLKKPNRRKRDAGEDFYKRRNAFAMMKKRRRILYDDFARRATVSESMPAQQTAERFGVGVSTLRRWATDYRRHGFRGLLDNVHHGVGSQEKRSAVVVGFMVLLITRLSWGASRPNSKARGLPIFLTRRFTGALRSTIFRRKPITRKGNPTGCGIDAKDCESLIRCGISTSRGHVKSLQGRCISCSSLTTTPASLSRFLFSIPKRQRRSPRSERNCLIKMEPQKKS